MERAEPALKPEWLKSSNHVNSSHPVSTSPHSDDQGVGISSRNRPSSDRKAFASTRRSLSSNGSRTSESGSGKSKAYSSFGSCRRERDRVRDYEIQKEKRTSLLDDGFDERLTDNSLRRSRSMVSGRQTVTDTWTKGINGSRNTNGVVSRSGTTSASFDKEFPSLGENGRPDPVRVSSPGISTALQSIPLGGVENWNSVLVEAPPAAVSNGLNSGNGSVAGNGISGNSPALLSPAPITVGPGTGLNMAETVAQAPSRARTPPQLTVDTQQKIDELTLKTSKKLIPVTPSMPKSLVSSSLDKKSKSQPLSSQPLSPAFRGSVRPTPDSTKPNQTGNFLVLNRDKNGISLPSKEPAPVATKSMGMAAPVASAVPLKSPTNRDRRAHSQSREKLEFFKFIRNQSLGNSREQGKDSNGDAGVSGSGLNPPLVEKETAESGGVLRPREEESRIMVDNGDADLGPDVDFLDPEEKEFLLSLGWEENAEVDALTKEEIEAFFTKHHLKQTPKSATEEEISCWKSS